MKVAVDGYWMNGPVRGMGRFARMLIADLGEDAQVLSPQSDSDRGDVSDRNRPSFPQWEQTILPRLARRSGGDVLLCPYNTAPLVLNSKLRIVLVLHDLIFMDKSLQQSVSLTQNIGKYYRRLLSPAAAKKAMRIITVSNYSKGLISRELEIPEEKITVIPNTIEDGWFNPRERVTRPPYILTVSGEAPSKNLPRLIAAFSRIAQASPELRLIIVGVKPSMHRHFHSMDLNNGLAGRVEFKGYVDDIELRDLYAGATLYVCASIAEGFGIPLLEAMASAVPLACSNTTSMPEVAGEAAWYFDPYETTSIADVISKCLREPQESRRKMEAGRKRATLFSRQNVAVKVAELWKRVDAELQAK